MATQSRAGGAAPQGSCLLSRGRSDRASRRGLRPSMEGGADAGEHRESRQRGGMRGEEGVKGTLVKVAYVAGPMLALCALIRLAEVAAVALGLALGTL